MQDRHKAHNLCAMRHMIRRITPVCSATDAGKCAADQIVYHCNALSSKAKTCIGEQDVVIDQCRSVADLHEDILRHHAPFERFGKCRSLVVMKQILGKSRALCLPVTPDAHRAVMNMIAAHNHIDCRMHFNSCNLRAALLHHVVDMVNVIVLDHTEDTAHAADNAALLTVMDVVAADDMASDVFLQPSVILAAAYRVALHLGWALHLLIREIMVVVRIKIFAE